MSRTAAAATGIVFLAAGVGLLALNVAGEMLPAPATTPASAGAAPGFSDRRIGRQAADERIARLHATSASGLEQARSLQEIVSDYLIHDECVVRPWDDWWWWAGGIVDPGRRDTLDADRIWRRGRGICHQASIVYAERARALGFEPRLVWMNGHVVAQVAIPGVGWRAVDPDMGVFWDGSVDEVVDRLGEEGIARVLVERGHPPDFARRIAATYATRDDNVVSLVPHLPERWRAERRAAWPKWLVPTLFAALGAGLVLASRRRP